MAVAATHPDEAAVCLADSELPSDPVRVQRRHWGLDQGGIARRLLRAWSLPHWLTLVVGHLGLPVEIAQSLGADPDLLHIVQAAVGLAQQRGHGLHLAVGGEPAVILGALGLSSQEQQSLGELVAEDRAKETTEWSPPTRIPHLSDLLSLAAEKLRLHDSVIREQLERECDELEQALREQRNGETDRLQKLKLQALAELAAGAAHEVNNPLAVISGQAQYLLGREEDPARQRALQTIISQAQRIHQVLTELMQFARPARPQKELLDICGLVREVALALGELSRQRDLRLDCREPEQAFSLYADARQIRTALQCLLRNALEAAPAGGWVHLYLQCPAADRLEFVVEDSGRGPPPDEREHLFDPFYSGRQAGRGRGLGLPTAWRLARENGGEVRYDDLPDGPTRFVLSLPCQPLESEPWKRDRSEQDESSNGCARTVPDDVKT
jgi:signal transduction histidine kinase